MVLALRRRRVAIFVRFHLLVGPLKRNPYLAWLECKYGAVFDEHTYYKLLTKQVCGLGHSLAATNCVFLGYKSESRHGG